jgi:hypothetical protein
MGTYSFLQLVAETERAFVFLSAKGFRVHEIGLVQPSSFRGGFVLRLVGPGTIALSYLELRLDVILNEHVNRSCASLRGTHKSNKRARDVPSRHICFDSCPTTNARACQHIRSDAASMEVNKWPKEQLV